MSQPRVPAWVADQAIEWFARLRADDVSSDDRASFFAWLKQGRENQRAFVEILELWEGLSVVADMDFDELTPFPPLAHYKRKVEAARP